MDHHDVGPAARWAALLLACVLPAACASSGRTGTVSPRAGPAVDWLNTTYTVTCDGIVPEGLRATVVHGTARVRADAGRSPYYDRYDISVTATATGDVDGDGAPDTVVLLECSPQPSNGVLQEVEILSPTGDLLGSLPSPRTLRGDAPLPPEYRENGLSVRSGEIVAEMEAYGPHDVHATGPSQPFTVRWRFDGREFVRTSS